MDDRQKELELQYARRASELDRQGRDRIDATQGALSFSGFGRSTFSAEQRENIQRDI